MDRRFLRLVVATFAAAVITVGAAEAQVVESPSEAIARLRAAFESGDVGALTARAARRVDVTIFGSGELFSPAQARYVLREFFREHPPVRLDLRETAGGEGNWFASGRYWFEGGARPLELYMRLRYNDGRWELREIRVGRSDQN